MNSHMFQVIKIMSMEALAGGFNGDIATYKLCVGAHMPRIGEKIKFKYPQDPHTSRTMEVRNIIWEMDLNTAVIYV
jgi:hypothetical protein